MLEDAQAPSCCVTLAGSPAPAHLHPLGLWQCLGHPVSQPLLPAWSPRHAPHLPSAFPAKQVHSPARLEMGQMELSPQALSRREMLRCSAKSVPMGQTHVWGTEDKPESCPSWMFCQCPASCPSPCPPLGTECLLISVARFLSNCIKQIDGGGVIGMGGHAFFPPPTPPSPPPPTPPSTWPLSTLPLRPCPALPVLSALLPELLPQPCAVPSLAHGWWQVSLRRG